MKVSDIGKVGSSIGKAGNLAGKGGAALGKAAGKGGAALGKGIGKALSGSVGRAIGKGGEKTGRAMGKAGEATGRAVGRMGAKVGNMIAKKALEAGVSSVATPAAGAVAGKAYDLAEKHKKEAAALALLLMIGSQLLMWLPLIILLFIVIGIADQTQYQQQQQNQQNQLQITKTGPSQAKMGDTLNYTITVTYPGRAQDVTITDTLPSGTTYIASCVGSGPCKKGQNDGAYNGSDVVWDAQALNLPLNNPIKITVSLALQATQNNTNIVNFATVSLLGASLGGGGPVPPNHNTCGGKYTLNNPIGNFGDPNCDFTKQALGQELSQLDSAHKYTWDCIARYESTGNSGSNPYNPNAYNGNSASGQGAYGLFQMNPKGKGTGVYDDGSEVWSLQTSNAIDYNNKVIGGSFTYWATDAVNGGPCH